MEKSNIYEIKESDLKEIFKTRKNDTHKGTYGYVGIIGGCLDYIGATKLATMSSTSLRSGCGVVKLIIPKSISKYVCPQILEQTIYPIDSDEENHMKFNKKQLDNGLKNLKAVAIGMGWGQGKDNEKILRFILENYNIPIIIDADGLNTLSQMDLEIIKESKAQIILTPHLKEFERLTKIDIEKIEENKIQIAKEFAEKYNIILLLKGHTTIITDGKEVYLVKRGCPGMATAGSGDVLSGILVGLLGYNDANMLTISAGAYLAGMAGEMAQEKYTDISMKSSDTIEFIPQAIKKIRKVY